MMPESRIVLAGTLDATTRDGFRAAAVKALDIAASARTPLVLDCRALDHVDNLGAAMLVALARTARGLATSIRLEGAPMHLRGRLELAAAIDLFDWCEGE